MEHPSVGNWLSLSARLPAILLLRYSSFVPIASKQVDKTNKLYVHILEILTSVLKDMFGAFLLFFQME